MSGFEVGAGDQQQDAKLTETERKLVARLFSDPTYFPIEFRLWLKNYIESSGISVTASQIRGGSRIRTGMPPGLFIACGSVGAIPPDALQCDGTPKSRITYAQLFAKIGTSWGPGDGTTTFNVPDIRDRALFGAGVTVVPGATDGQAAASRKGAVHQHGAHDHGGGSHSHAMPNPAQAFNRNPGSGSTGTGAGDRNIVDVVSTNPSGAIISSAQIGPAGALQDAPNWAGVIYAITTGQTG